METLQIQFESKNRNKIIELLNSFPDNGVQILHEDPHFEENKRVLQERLNDLRAGKGKLYSFKEANEILEKTISEYES
jgi:hypothetical protein